MWPVRSAPPPHQRREQQQDHHPWCSVEEGEEEERLDSLNNTLLRGIPMCCQCCYNLLKVILLLLVWPLSLVVSLLGILVFVLLFPFYAMGKYCCCPACCLVVCMEDLIVKKMIRLPFTICASICSSTGDALWNTPHKKNFASNETQSVISYFHACVCVHTYFCMCSIYASEILWRWWREDWEISLFITEEINSYLPHIAMNFVTIYCIKVYLNKI